MKTLSQILSSAVLTLALFSSCSEKVEPTTVKVKDPVRHYYPVLTGQELVVMYELTNTGNSPLVIREIQACCGCIPDDDNNARIIPPGKNGFIVLRYNSDKNVGLVNQRVWIYGNIQPNGMLELNYDVHVVPNADYTRDYEELYRARMEKEKPVERAVNGTEAQKGYYVNLDAER